MKLWLVLMIVISNVFVGVAGARQDNSVNPRVVDQSTGLTAGDQSNKPADILIAKKIRSELMKDTALSMRAKNIKIISVNNGVTLKGTVLSTEERARILEHAYISAPKHRIYNQISVMK